MNTKKIVKRTGALFVVAAASAALFAPSAAEAGTSASTLTINATVSAACTVAFAATSINLPNYVSNQANSVSSGADPITITCTGAADGFPITTVLNPSGGAYTMTGTGGPLDNNTLAYTVGSAAGSGPNCNGVYTAGQSFAQTTTSGTASIPFFVCIPGGIAAVADGYTASVTANLTF